ncbi:MAG TPA: AAA family ATPase [Nitrososphaeraceae archaeon]|nr:AAA family ATPase [Nitrososphaeraceae archaeon]
MDKQDLKRIFAEVEKENLLFANKTFLDNLTLPSKIIGRETQAKELIRFLLGYKQGLVVPFVSVYGRSGSGKSTVVKFVCENLDEDVSYAFVNLRKARTVFGCANLILAELGQPSLKSAQGINIAIEEISNTIEQGLSNKKNNTRLFILVLDEFDVLLYDKRGKPSDFIYKLLVMEEKLREKGYLMCIIAISNNVMSDYEIDDRVRSRIGTSEVFFDPYRPQTVLALLKDRAEKAFSEPVDSVILQYCADQSSKEHGDARRAIDLLRFAAEIAGRGGEKISKKHIDEAVGQLQKDRISTTLSSASYHLKLAAAALARISYLTEEVWHSTSTLYDQYRHIISKDGKQLTYRRFSELLTELENMGLVVSHTSSKGRHGYGTQFKLVVSPEIVGKVCFPGWWMETVRKKKQHKTNEELDSLFTPKQRSRNSSARRNNNSLGSMLSSFNEHSWKEFVGSD